MSAKPVSVTTGQQEASTIDAALNASLADLPRTGDKYMPLQLNKE